MSTTLDHKTAAGGTPPVYIGRGVQFAGSIRHSGDSAEQAVIEGEFDGDIDWNGVLHIPPGGKVVVAKHLRCREIVVAGKIESQSEEVLVETGLLRLADTAEIDVATLSVPPGGLEQARGSVVNARLRMAKDHPFAEQQKPAAAPRLLLAVQSAQQQGSGQVDSSVVGTLDGEGIRATRSISGMAA